MRDFKLFGTLMFNKRLRVWTDEKGRRLRFPISRAFCCKGAAKGGNAIAAGKLHVIDKYGLARDFKNSRSATCFGDVQRHHFLRPTAGAMAEAAVFWCGDSGAPLNNRFGGNSQCLLEVDEVAEKIRLASVASLVRKP